MTTEDAPIRIAEAIAAAVAGVLEAHCPGGVTTHAPAVADGDADPGADIALPVLVADGSDAAGGTLFFMPLPAVRALAAALMGVDPSAADPDPHTELTELELSGAGEVADQIMAAAAGAISTVTRQEVKPAAPQTRVIASGDEVLAAIDPGSTAVSVSIDLLSHPCRLVQLMPQALVARAASALEEQPPGTAALERPARSVDLLGGVGLRVAAELGRVRMTIRRASSLAPGTVVELDRDLEDPIDLYVNGRRFATGRLVTLDGGEWAVRIDTVAFSPSD
jgi:flagellar motor switch protein FliN/FliY